MDRTIYWSLLIVALLAQATLAQAQQKYNVLFIASDDLAAVCSSYGGPAITPNIDALAKVGVRFDKAYCQFALCNPSRSSMLTGRHPTTTNVLGNGGNVRQLHPDWVSLPQLFKDNGYVSLRSGKMFHGGIDDPLAWTEVARSGGEGGGGGGGKNMVFPEQPVPPKPAELPPAFPGDINQRAGSDRVVILDGNGEKNPDYHVAEATIEFLRKYKDQPFFIGCGFAKPHSAPAASQQFFDLYDIAKIALPPDFGAWPFVPAGFPAMSVRTRNADLFIDRGASELEAKEYIRAYYASTSWMDWNVGRVIKELDALGLREKTIIVFWGDHGYQLGEKGKWSKAGSLFELGTRVPLIIAMPTARGNGKASPRPVQLLDVYPTLAELCGLKIQDGIEGKSLAPLLNDPQAAWDRPAYTVWSEDGRSLWGTAVRTEKWRYAEYGPNGEGGAMMLDLVADPKEVKNVADDPRVAADRAELSKLVRKYASNLGKTQL